MKIFAQLLFIAAAVGIFVWYINPTYKSIQQKKIDLTQLEDANKKAVELKAAREKILADKNKISPSQLATLSKFLPDGIENVRLIIDIKNITNEVLQQDPRSPRVVGSADKKGTPVNAGSATVGPDGKKYGAIGVTFGVTTTYEKFIVFLQALEKNLRLVDISDISFSATDDGKYDFSIALQTYWLK